MARGGKRAGAGRKPGSNSDKIKASTYLTPANAAWLAVRKGEGVKIEYLINLALDLLRKSGAA